MDAKSVCRKAFSVLVVAAMALAVSLAWGVSQAHASYDGNPYEGLVNQPDKKVKFNGYEWFVIADNSTSATAGSVTLLAADSSFGQSQYSSSRNSYDLRNSSVKKYLDDVYNGDAGQGKPDFWDVHDVILYNEEADGRLYLLSVYEAQNLKKVSRSLVTQFSFWWTRSKEFSYYLVRCELLERL